MDILLIEDNPGDVHLLREYALAGAASEWNIRVAETLGKGLQQVLEKPTDLIVLDLNLPDSNGIETFFSVQERAGSVPIIVLSGSDDDRLALRAVEAGAQDYVVKGPVGFQILRRTIAYAVERSRAQDRLRKAQSMEAIARLAAGIAHEFNNLMMVINSNAEMAASRDINDPTLARQLERIANASGKSALLIRQLIAFSRQQMLQTEILPLGNRVGKICELLKLELPSNIRLTCTAPSPECYVNFEAKQLEEILRALISNSVEATDGPGDINVFISRLTLQHPRQVGVTELPPGSYTLLRVTDTGRGIPAEVIDRVFEPFYTTKPPNRRAGLGLATVYGTVLQYGGSILAESEKGRGTTMTILLPSAELPVPGLES